MKPVLVLSALFALSLFACDASTNPRQTVLVRDTVSVVERDTIKVVGSDTIRVVGGDTIRISVRDTIRGRDTIRIVVRDTIHIVVPDTTKPVDPDTTHAAMSLEQLTARLALFHFGGAGADSADLRNAARVYPDDSIDLIPSGLAVPSNYRILWQYTEDSAPRDLDPAKPLRVALHDGVELSIKGTGWRLVHSIRPDLGSPDWSTNSGYGWNSDPKDADDWVLTAEYFPGTMELGHGRPGAIIYYTVDGSYPTSKSAVYTTGIVVTGPGTLRAMAQVAGGHPSESRRVTFKRVGGWNPAVRYDTLVDSRDGRAYPTITLGSQTWFASNLNWKIPGARTSILYGTSYTADQAQADGDQKVCPEGWHVPSAANWDTLTSWATRQPGVYPSNVGAALSTNILDEVSDNVDLFGFRLIGGNQWINAAGSTSEKAWQKWYVAGGFPTMSVPHTDLAFIRCLKD